MKLVFQRGGQTFAFEVYIPGKVTCDRQVVVGARGSFAPLPPIKGVVKVPHGEGEVIFHRTQHVPVEDPSFQGSRMVVVNVYVSGGIFRGGAVDGVRDVGQGVEG